jgi:hypothetical protein
MPRTIDRLVLVYAADSGAFAAFVDSARKLLRLNGCTLCAITHGPLGEKAEWKDCKAELGVPIDYLHRDELDAELTRLVGDALPAVVAETAAGRVLLLGPEVLERCKTSVAELKGKLLWHARVKGLELPGSPPPSQTSGVDASDCCSVGRPRLPGAIEH